MSWSARSVVVLLDLVLQAGAASAGLLIAGSPLIMGMGPKRSTLLIAVVYAVLWGIAACRVGVYSREIRVSVRTQWLRRAQASTLVLTIVGTAVLLGFLALHVGAALVWAIGLSLVIAGVAGAWIERLLTPTRCLRDRAILVGTEDSICRSATRLDDSNCFIDVVGTIVMNGAAVDQEPDLSDRLGLEVSISHDVQSLDASVVILTTDAHVLGLHPMRLVWALESVGAVLIADTGLNNLPDRRVAVQRVGGLLAYVARPRRAWTVGTAVSGIVQWLLAGVGLILLSPMMMMLALWVRMDSRGRALFVQQRVGRDGRLFPMYKFRTMIEGADQMVDNVMPEHDAPDRGPMFKAANDHRVTRAGRFLRRSSLDELPQLINVVLGHMRLIGPRPALPKEVGNYQGYEHRRLLCKPGMTGLWQVNGRSNLDWRRSVELDQKYVDDRSLYMDAGIIGKTPRAVFNSRGAY